LHSLPTGLRSPLPIAPFQLGWNDVSWHKQGGNQVQTPKLAALANEGVLLSNYYVYRFCSPSRSTFMTGRYPSHVGQQTSQNLNPTPGIACGINLKYDFMSAVLRKAGYRTHALGKWHLGYFKPSYTPTGRGFDTYTGYYSGAEEHFTHYKAGEGKNYFDLANNSGADLRPLKAWCGHKKTETEKYYSVYLYGNETTRLIRRHAHEYKAQPIYFYLAWNVVHAPDEAPAAYVAQNAHIANANRRNFAGMLSALDDSALAVVDELKAQQMWDDTIFVFSTDNGGNLGGGGNNLPLRGGKYTFWEGGTRGVGFITSPLLPKGMAGRSYGGLIHAVDWYTTFAALGGAAVSATGPLPADGINVWPALVANKTDAQRSVLIQCMSANMHGQKLNKTLGAVRQGKWKYIDGYPGWKDSWDGHFPLPGPDNVVDDEEQRHEGQMIPQSFRDALAAGEGGDSSTAGGRRALQAGPKPPYKSNCSDISGEGGSHCCTTTPCLFDLSVDAGESHDVAAANPAVVAEMAAFLAKFQKTEVSLPNSGLCPTNYSTGSDPRCAEAAAKIDPPFWVPWCADTGP